MTNYAQIRFRKESKKYSCPYLEIDKYFHFYLLFFLGFDFINERLLNRASRISASEGFSFSLSFFFFFLEEDFSGSVTTGVDVSNETLDFRFFLLGEAELALMTESSISVFLRFLLDFEVSSSLWIALSESVTYLKKIKITKKKLKFLSSNQSCQQLKCLKPQHFHEFFIQKIDNFLGRSKLNFWTKNEDFEQCVRVSF